MRFLLVMVLSFSLHAESVLPLAVGQTWTYRGGDQSVTNRVVTSLTVGGETWYQTREFAIDYWLVNRVDGVYMTHADLSAGEAPADAFMLFPRQTMVGHSWNPDGVQITVLGVNEVIMVDEVMYTCSVYGYDLGAPGWVILWLSPGIGIVRQVQDEDGVPVVFDLVADQPEGN